MKALILAAGKGERLKPVTDTRPKPLVPVLCRPLIEWILKSIEKINALDTVVIIVSYLKEKVTNYVEKLNLGIKTKFIDQGSELGTGDAVIKGIEVFSDLDDDVLIIYSDVFLSNWNVLREIISASGNVIAGVSTSDPRNYGVLVSENNILRNIVEKPDKPLSNLVNAGIYKLKIRDIHENKDVKPSPRGEVEFTDIVNNIARSREIRVVDISSKTKWIDIGLPWSIIDANKIALEELVKSNVIKGVIEEKSVVKPPVYIGENTIIRSGSYIEGPVYIDSFSEIGPCARIRPYSVICSGSRIGFSVEVKESIVMEHVHASHLSYIGDSIVCEYVNLGAGTITANLRFDEKPVSVTIKNERISSGRRKLGAIIGGFVKTGVHVSIMPGVKIGSYSWISPGAVVSRDVPPRSFLRFEVNYFIENLP